MLSLIQGHPRQNRAELVCDSRLAALARAKAGDMGIRKYFGHENPATLARILDT